MKAFGASDIEKWQFEHINLPEIWSNHIGDLCKGTVIHVRGNSGEGKTSYLFQLTKVLAANFGRVLYNSVEQGKSRSIQAEYQRQNMAEVSGKWALANRDCKQFAGFMKKARMYRVLVLDSVDWAKWSLEQIMELIDRYGKTKIIILVTWARLNEVNNAIMHASDVKVNVKDFQAEMVSRLGGNQPYIIWEDGYRARKGKKSNKPTNQTNLFK